MPVRLGVFKKSVVRQKVKVSEGGGAKMFPCGTSGAGDTHRIKVNMVDRFNIRANSLV